MSKKASFHFSFDSAQLVGKPKKKFRKLARQCSLIGRIRSSQARDRDLKEKGLDGADQNYQEGHAKSECALCAVPVGKSFYRGPRICPRGE